MDLFSRGLPEHRRPIHPLSITDIIELENGEGGIPDWRIAELLGFKYPPEIRRLIDRHRSMLERRGTLWQRAIKSTGGRPGTEYRLNRKQTLYIIAQSGAENAGEILLLMIDVFDEWVSGKLVPVDTETHNRLNTAAEIASRNAPEIFGMLQDLLGRVASEDRLASVQRTALEIQQRLGDLIKRRHPPVRNVDVYDQVVRGIYLDRCPCCMRPDRAILKEDGTRTKLYQLDHWTGNKSKNALHEMWPVCDICNSKLEHDPRYRNEMADRFRVFQSHVQNIAGERFI